MQDSTINKALYAFTILANKLNTTADHLWKVLIAQSKVAFIEYTIQYILLGIFIILLYNIHKILSEKKTFDDKGYKESRYEYYLGAAAIPMIILIIIAVIWLITAIACIGDYLTTFMNPEYYALSRVTELLK